MRRNLFAALSQRLFPPRCLLCDMPVSGPDICEGCRADLPRLGPACPLCAMPQDAAGSFCAGCLAASPPMYATLAPFAYEFPVDWLLTELKFGGILTHGPLLARLLADSAWPMDIGGSVVVPVPLHRARLRQRGYNQALEIARPLATLLGLDVETRILRRVRPTLEQSSLGARRRRGNVLGAFSLSRRPRFTDAILVDDVVTTGATCREAARVLLEGGCRRVMVAAVARALRSQLKT